MEGNLLSHKIIQLPQRRARWISSKLVFCEVCPFKKENFELRCERGYWQKQHQRAVEREEKLREENQQLKARIRYLEKELYGRKTEKRSRSSEHREKEQSVKRPRGHQVGASGHGRRRYEHLPVVEEVYELAEEEGLCPFCGLSYEVFPGTEDSEEIEIEVRAYRRKIRRKRYTPRCQCEGLPGIITAKAPGKLIAKGKLGISVWAMILVEKYLYQRPISRLLESLKGYGVDVAPGTVGDGLKRLAGLFSPVQKAIREKSKQERWWHADETRWSVFQMPEGKMSHRWYLWVFVSASAVVYILDPRRSADVVEEHLGEIEEGILCVDRYSAYKKFARGKEGIILAFCWTHQRRDFLKVANGWPELEAWAHEWVHEIGQVFHLNHKRLAHEKGSEGFVKADRELREALAGMEQRRDEELSRKKIDGECISVLKSLKNHWEGLRVFIDHPHIPMDNSEAERRMRGPALGRKNYYGSGSIRSGHFTASLFSVFQTLLKWQINPRQWLSEYLSACAENGGEAPEDIFPFLPWKMGKEDRKRMRMVRIRGDPA